MTMSSHEVPFLKRVKGFGDRLAILDEEGAWTYQEIWDKASQLAGCLLDGKADLQEQPVAFMAPPGLPYVASQWAIWMAGGIAVPLCLKHPLPEIEYVLEDTGASTVIVHAVYQEFLSPLSGSRRIISTNDGTQSAALPIIDTNRAAQILYTSGTTSRPKGVVTTHANLTAQIGALVDAWGWHADDRILHVLPLHHTHGIVNVLLCALWSGAVCEMLPAFDAEEVWRRIKESPLTLFMAVPTIYQRLIKSWNAADPSEQVARSQACGKMRLMVSGSAALPVSVLETWRGMTGHTLLERYGMTEIGMALSNPLEGERRPGTVGQPLPSVEIRLVDDEGCVVEHDGAAGEIQVKGPSVFREYWKRPEATEEAFKEEWFLTGDRSVRRDGYYQILGRMSVDIIKTGGYKVSALEIEEVLRTHKSIQECAVVGVMDEDWGERVCAGIVLKAGTELDAESLRNWAKALLAPYKVPSKIAFLDDLPRNVMGKVTKPALKQIF